MTMNYFNSYFYSSMQAAIGDENLCRAMIIVTILFSWWYNHIHTSFSWVKDSMHACVYTDNTTNHGDVLIREGLHLA